MKVRIWASTKLGYQCPLEEAMQISGIASAICYEEGEFEQILEQPPERAEKRVKNNIKSGHHSVTGHVDYIFALSGIPKIIAMLLNNEKEYNTSERSARYVRMHPEGLELELYEKWLDIFSDVIREKCPRLVELEELDRQKNPKVEPNRVKKLAQENARYFISVFTPSTNMAYKTSIRQAGYIIHWARLLAQRKDTPFYQMLSPYLIELADTMSAALENFELNDMKNRNFSLFAERVRREIFDEVYSTNYVGTFAQLAQAHRHRSLSYEMIIPDYQTAEFFIPPIIKDDEKLCEEYIADMKKIAHRYPQGMKIQINERGTPEGFILKCLERKCGAAQLEICTQTEITLIRYVMETENEDIKNMLIPYIGKTKCQLLEEFTCNRPCVFGPNHAFDRII